MGCCSDIWSLADSSGGGVVRDDATAGVGNPQLGCWEDPVLHKLPDQPRTFSWGCRCLTGSVSANLQLPLRWQEKDKLPGYVQVAFQSSVADPSGASVHHVLPHGGQSLYLLGGQGTTVGEDYAISGEVRKESGQQQEVFGTLLCPLLSQGV